MPPDAAGQPQSIRVVSIDSLLQLLKSGELLPTTKVFMPAEGQSAGDAVQLKRLVNMKEVNAQKKRAGKILGLGAEVAAEQAAAVAEQTQLAAAQAEVADRQEQVDGWERAEDTATMVVTAGLSALAVVAGETLELHASAAAGKLQRTANEAAAVVVGGLVGELVSQVDGAQGGGGGSGGGGAAEPEAEVVAGVASDPVGTPAEATAAAAAGAEAPPDAAGALRNAIAALEQEMKASTAAEDFDRCELLARELVTLESQLAG
eukprot:SAG22_NODE_3398_length_1734_cov_1.614679_2_plen_262_part_00